MERKINIKICCIGSLEEARLAIRMGASAIGLVGHMPSGPGIIPDETIAEIAKAIPPTIESFLLTSETKSENIIEHHRRTKTTTIQLVDKVSSKSYRDIRAALSDVKLVQVIHVLNEASVAEAIEVAKYADVLLLDSGNPFLSTKILGGTGMTHNWEISQKIVEQVEIPVYLAGGINALNVRQAIETVQPFGVDICNSVRSEDRLDATKLFRLFNALELL